ncbi:hypothetical protein LINPERPRIM_LOCUS29685 [Linum perenne]
MTNEESEVDYWPFQGNMFQSLVSFTHDTSRTRKA